jgi:glycerol-3-phosphate O-acyltransferase
VLERFVQMAVEGGLTQVVFPEGGLSRDGALREPKTGLLDYMLRRFDPAGGRDLVFVPVAIDYDWVLEDESLLELCVSGPSHGRTTTSTAVSVIRKIQLLLRCRRLARAAVNFGTPISAREYASAHDVDFRALGREERVERVRILARALMQTIGEIMPVVPVPVIARIFVGDPGGVLSASETTGRAQALMSDLRRRGSTTPLKGSDLEAALRLLTVRRLLIVDRDLYRVAPGSEKILGYYANATRTSSSRS